MKTSFRRFFSANIILSDTSKTKEFKISWSRLPDQKPLENCIEMSLWVDKSYKPGTKTLAKEDNIVISLNKIVEFYGSTVTLEYVPEDEILYVVVK